ncbi:MAG: hydantoinase/oxoprolinase family protein [Thermomicrobiales bacterium]|nr:hydantoinase/oxoprolinase family protein [Thermomicrobiales bacterium]
MRVAVDIGGTFTDVVVFDEATGATFEAKSSTTPSDFSQGVLDAISVGEIAPEAIDFLVHGTTVVINAITQRTGVKTALVTTQGFRDALAIGRGNRPDMYNLRFHKPEPFVPRSLRFEVHERVNAQGDVLLPLDTADMDRIVETCRDQGVEAIAVCFLHSYAHTEHEEIAATYLRERLPGIAVTASSEITKEWREYERTSTAVLNAYVQPILDRYLGNLESKFRERDVPGHLHVMLSNGGTATFESARRQPIQLVESGPAAGIIGAALIGKQLGEPNVISLDIGGTTAKCSLIENNEVKISGDYRLEWTPLSPGYPVRVPVVDIVEIGAGGGSIAWFDDGGALHVGPISAGADPGPAAYGRGGTKPTVTDAMFITGILDPASFLGGRLQVDVELSRHAYRPIAERLGVTVDQAAAGVIRLVNEYTIDALKLVSVRRGYDPRDFTLVAFGGGGPMHASALAGELGVKRVVIPPFPGTFSAWGMLMTEPRIDLTRTRVLSLTEDIEADIAGVFAALEADATRRLDEQGFDRALILHRRALDMRYNGQEHTVRLQIHGAERVDGLAAAFHQAHQQQYTFALEGTPIQIVNFRITSTVDHRRPAYGRVEGTGAHAGDGAASGQRCIDVDGARTLADVYRRSSLSLGYRAVGPAIIEEASATTVVLPGQQFEVDGYGNLVISASSSRRREPA